MTVIFQNGQITAVDKKLLQILNCTLEDIGKKISELDLALNSLQNSKIQIENKTFSVKEEEIVTIENLKIYHLETEEQSFETLPFDIKPLEKETSEKSEDLTTSLQDMFSSETTIVPLETKEPASEEKVIEAETGSNEISITFEDEFEEIEKILSLNEQEAKNLILQDLKKAAEDFDMDLESIKELYTDLIKQIETSKNDFYNAIQEKDYEKMHKISHSLKGASLNLRVSNLAIILKTIDEKSKENISFDKLEFLVNNFYTFVNKVKTLQESKNNISQTQIPTFLKELILETIKNYTATQNEKRLKKDLKYIEKLLNVKISSIEELQDMIKAKK